MSTNRRLFAGLTIGVLVITGLMGITALQLRAQQPANPNSNSGGTEQELPSETAIASLAMPTANYYVYPRKASTSLKESRGFMYEKPVVLARFTYGLLARIIL